MASPPDLDPLIDLRATVPDLVLDIRYARRDNAFETAFYPFPAAYMRRSAALKVARAADSLRRRGLRLKVFDAYRPLSVQRLMWEALPDARFVADPYHGGPHNRGAAVDVTLVGEGGELEMPSDFDDFSAKASHHSPFAAPAARRNLAVLREAMEGAGMAALPEEWWHYYDPLLKDAPLIDLPFGAL